MRQIECFFWFDGDSDTLEAIIRPMCQKCHDDSANSDGWFYDGPAGPWEYKCGKCGDVILEEFSS